MSILHKARTVALTTVAVGALATLPVDSASVPIESSYQNLEITFPSSSNLSNHIEVADGATGHNLRYLRSIPAGYVSPGSPTVKWQWTTCADKVKTNVYLTAHYARDPIYVTGNLTTDVASAHFDVEMKMYEGGCSASFAPLHATKKWTDLTQGQLESGDERADSSFFLYDTTTGNRSDWVEFRVTTQFRRF
jgi:hypothetical protein